MRKENGRLETFMNKIADQSDISLVFQSSFTLFVSDIIFNCNQRYRITMELTHATDPNLIHKSAGLTLAFWIISRFAIS